MKHTGRTLFFVLFSLTLTIVASSTAMAQSDPNRRLLVACCNGYDLNEAAALDAIKGGADINWQNPAMSGETMLINAIKAFQEPKVVKFLLDHGADASIKDDTGKTAL